MKTSNKILIGLALLIYAVPLTQSFILKRKFENGEYVIDKNRDFNGRDLAQRALPAGGYSIVKFEGFRALNVVLSPEQDEYFSYENWWNRNDSVKVFLAGDTLKVRFTSKDLDAFLAGKEMKPGEGYNHTVVSLRFPVNGIKNMLLEGTSMYIPRGRFEQPLSIHTLGNWDNKFEVGAENSSDSVSFNHLDLAARGGDVIVHNNAHVDSMYLNIGDGTRFKINKARFNKLSASASEDAVVDAPVSFLRQLLK